MLWCVTPASSTFLHARGYQLRLILFEDHRETLVLFPGGSLCESRNSMVEKFVVKFPRYHVNLCALRSVTRGFVIGQRLHGNGGLASF